MTKLNTSGKKSVIHPTDVYLAPHLGVSSFGISADHCMAAILTEMECLLRINKKAGKEDGSFCTGFKVAGTNLEWTRTKISSFFRQLPFEAYQ